MKLTILDRIKEGQKKEPTVQKWVERVQKGELPDFNLGPDGIPRFRNRIIVPKDEELKREILEESHRSRCTVHPGVDTKFLIYFILFLFIDNCHLFYLINLMILFFHFGILDRNLFIFICFYLILYLVRHF